MQYILIIFFPLLQFPPNLLPPPCSPNFIFSLSLKMKIKIITTEDKTKIYQNKRKKKHGVLDKGLSQDWLIDPVTLYWREQIFPAPAGITCKYHLCRHFALFEHRQVL